jgi:hypothetical protein
MLFSKAHVCIQNMNMSTVQMEEDFLDEHNAYRREVGRDDLVWDSDLAEVSLTLPISNSPHWFTNIHLCTFVHVYTHAMFCFG